MIEETATAVTEAETATGHADARDRQDTEVVVANTSKTRTLPAGDTEKESVRIDMPIETDDQSVEAIANGTGVVEEDTAVGAIAMIVHQEEIASISTTAEEVEEEIVANHK